MSQIEKYLLFVSIHYYNFANAIRCIGCIQISTSDV